MAQSCGTSCLQLDTEEGPYYAIDKAWIRTFQVPEDQQCGLVCRGEYGMPGLYKILAHVGNLPSMEPHGQLVLFAERLEWLNRLITQVYVNQNCHSNVLLTSEHL